MSGLRRRLVVLVSLGSVVVADVVDLEVVEVLVDVEGMTTHARLVHRSLGWQSLSTLHPAEQVTYLLVMA